MRKIYLLLVVLMSTTAGWAQSFGKAEYEALKSLTIDNLERDSYVVFDEEGFILDRYELKPAYVFNFSDEIERKIYLYLVYPLETEDTLGCLMFYQREDVTIALPVPGAQADRDAWGLYIDDLKYTGEDESGFLACVSFVISKEFAGLLAGSGAGAEEEGEYEYCFAKNAVVSLSDNRQIEVAALKPGMELLSWDDTHQTMSQTTVTGIDIHLRESIDMYEIWVTDPTMLLSSEQEKPTLKRLYLTPNHPVATPEGILRAEEISAGMKVYLQDRGALTPVSVIAARASHLTEEAVYSILTDDEPFFVEGVLVWPK